MPENSVLNFEEVLSDSSLPEQSYTHIMFESAGTVTLIDDDGNEHEISGLAPGFWHPLQWKGWKSAGAVGITRIFGGRD